MRSKTIFKLFSFLILTGLFFQPINSQADNWSVGLGGNIVSVTPGDFDGTSVISTDFFIYPDTQRFDMPYPAANSNGFLIRGAYNRRRISGEIQFAQSSHDIKKSSLYNLPEGQMTYSFVDFNCKLNMPVMMADLYLLLGVNYALLSIDNGEVVGYISDNEIYDTTYFGAGFNIGAGISYYMTPYTSIFGEYIYRFTGYNQVSDVMIDENVYSGGIGALLLGVSFHIPAAAFM